MITIWSPSIPEVSQAARASNPSDAYSCTCKLPPTTAPTAGAHVATPNSKEALEVCARLDEPGEEACPGLALRIFGHVYTWAGRW
ncbi:hypothetical protein [Polyangium mundeleinium]|uniref:Ferredoxin n=1 Tax=Polyangium mundeleinium TaxID=2995306 RepID=A0ABT5F0X9_9BACT|nr:hypothetical protein [Polyangium mundeleinium]MDC0747741.1 hypothetical protein [Polyangium mundeleinium]